MAAGHLRVQNGVYQMILSYKDVNESELESISVLTTLPEMKLPISNTDAVSESRLINITDIDAVASQRISESATDVIPSLDSSLLLKPKEEIRFCDYMLYWLQSSRKTIEADTYAGYHYAIQNRIYPYFADKGHSLADIEKQPFLIQAYYDYEMEVHGISANTVAHRHANIRKALQDAFKVGLIKSNPADRITKPKVDTFETTVYNQNELSTLFEVFKDDPLELAVILGSFYGLRRSEIVGLKWNCIDFERKTITIRHR